MKKKILSIGIAVILLIVGLFLGAQYSWKLFGFQYCVEPSGVYVESVEPGKGCYLVIGDIIDSSSSFVGYTYKVEGDNIYIGLKYNTFLGFLRRDSSFNVKVDCDTDGKSYNIYLVGDQDEKLIWPTESAN